MLSHHERKNMAISKSGLPQKVLELFDPREDLEFRPPIDKKKPVLPLVGLAGYVGHFPNPDDPEYRPPLPQLAQSRERKFRSREYIEQVSVGEPSILERREVKQEEKQAAHVAAQEAAVAAYDPKSDPNAGDSDPMKTLFVCRLDYRVTEQDLYSEFEKHGPIRNIKLVRDQSKKSRGYAFIEFSHLGDMKTAYKAYPSSGQPLCGYERVCLVDVERGRTMPDWRPMRLGQGKGGESRLPGAKQGTKRPDGSGAPGGAGSNGHMDSRSGAAPDRSRRPMDGRSHDDGRCVCSRAGPPLLQHWLLVPNLPPPPSSVAHSIDMASALGALGWQQPRMVRSGLVRVQD